MSITAAASTEPFKGIALMVLALFLLTLSDATTKWLGAAYPVGEIVCIRTGFAMLPVVVMVARSGGLASIRVNDAKGQAIRAMLYVVSTVLIASSMILLPLADAASLLFAGPLFIAALSMPMLREPVGWQRWCAVIVGFLGVLIMLRPTPAAIQPLALLPLAAALCSALRDIVTRRIAFTETSNAIMFWGTLALILASALVAPFGWRTPDWTDVGLMALAGILVGTAHYMMIGAYRYAEAALVSPFKYTAILWAATLGYVIWGDIPDLFIITGGALVIASGLYILRHEATRR